MKENEIEETNNEIKNDLTEDVQEKKKEKPAKGSKKHDKKVNEELESLGNKLIEFNDKYLRLSAEFDNYRKRTLKEKTDLLKTASADVITSLLPVLDDFERALKSFENIESNPAHDGVRLIYNKFRDNLVQKGLKEIEAVNRSHSRHERKSS